MKKNKLTLILAILVVVFVASFVSSKFGKSKLDMTNLGIFDQETKRDVATDPNFTEVKGELIEGFPSDFPMYPNATLVASAKVNPEDVSDQGYRARWEVKDGSTTTDIILWYKKELAMKGWKFTDPNDMSGVGELIAKIENKDQEYMGYIAAEEEEAGEVKLIVDIRKD